MMMKVLLIKLNDNLMVNDDRSLMHMHMSNSLKESIVHAHTHPIIFCMQCICTLCQGPGSDTSKLLVES